MVQVHVSIIAEYPEGAYPATDAPVGSLTNDELAVVLAQVVDELCSRAVWSGPRPTVRLVPDGWLAAVGVGDIPRIRPARESHNPFTDRERDGVTQ